MKKFRKEFSVTTVGYYEVVAKNEAEAEIKFDAGGFEAVDTDSHTDIDENWDDFGEE